MRNSNYIWYQLYTEQTKLLKKRAYDKFLSLLDVLQLPQDRVPQLHEVSLALENKIGWSVVRVDSGISFKDYMQLLSNKMLPSTTYMRESIEFAKDPDIFHEIFGHVPTLLDFDYADFLVRVAKTSLNSPPLETILLQRLLWFTMEVGLVQTHSGLRAYGSSLLSSPKELIYSLEDHQAEKKAFNLLDICRSPYRSDIIQSTYYVIDNFEELYNLDLSYQNLAVITQEALRLKEFIPLFKIEQNKYTNVNCF